MQDLRDIENVLLSPKYRFQKKDIITLRNDQATRENILQQFKKHLIEQARPGDVVFFYFSGHGSRLENPNELSGWDNTIVPYDSRDREKNVWDIRDKELNLLFRELSKRTDRITAVLDSCFSGTGLRGARRSRRAPDDERFGRNPPPLLPGSDNTRAILPAESGFYAGNARYVLLAASRTDQLSFEYFVKGHWHGAFTYFLASELMRPTNRITYRDVMERTIAAVMDVYPDQTPQMEGTTIDNVIFNDDSVVPRRYVMAFPSGPKRITIQGGLEMGFTKGSIFDVYPPGTREFDTAIKPKARILLDQVEAAQSTGRIVNGTQIQAASRALEQAHQYERIRARVFYEDLRHSQSLQRLKDVVDHIAGGPSDAVEKREMAQLFFREQKNQQDGKAEIVMMGVDGTPLGLPLKADAPSLEKAVIRRVLTWSRWFQVVGLRNENSPGVVSLSLEPDPQNRGASAGVFKPGSNPNLLDGDNFNLTITNESANDLFIYLLDLTDNGRISLLFPVENGVEPLHGYSSYKLSDLNVEIADAKRTKALDIIKVIATTRPVPIEYLQQEAIKGTVDQGSMDPITRLLFVAFQGSKDNEMPKPPVRQWDSAQIVITVEAAGR